MQKTLLQVFPPITLIALALCTNAFADEPVQVAVHSRSVTTDKLVVTVEDLAKVTGGTTAQRNQISKLDVEVFSGELRTIKISRRQIEMRIALSQLSNATPVGVIGPETIEVQRHSVTEIPLQLESIVRRELSKQFNLVEKDISAKLAKGQRTKEIAQQLDLKSLRGTVIFPAQLPLGQHMVRLELEDGMGQHLSVELRFRIVVKREVFVTNTNIPQGTVLTAEYFERTQRPMDDHRIRLASIDQLVGKVAARTLQENLVMQTNFVSDQKQFEQYTVKRNSIVDIVKVLGTTEIRWRNARVLTPGRVGDAVEVMNLQSKKKLVAIVHDESTVIVR